jgi:hypothetical protein
MNERKRIRVLSSVCVIGAIASGEPSSCGSACGFSLSPTSEQAPHTPLALTDAVHLLYLVPQTLQIATIAQPNEKEISHGMVSW